MRWAWVSMRNSFYILLNAADQDNPMEMNAILRDNWEGMQWNQRKDPGIQKQEEKPVSLW
jgi:hypothetical protein